MKITKAISIPNWNDEARDTAIAYWQSRGIVFTDVSEDRLTGKRGSPWGNMTSFDMSKLVAILMIDHVKDGEVICVLDVDTSFQAITEWNAAYWGLEMDTFESVLLHGDAREQEWREFQKNSRAAAWRWTLSFTLLGHKRGRL
ncbi:MAG: YopJ Serine/Threonine acetyltransferase protein [Capsulimonas sp.]|jgi:hypothetical protein|nr:YopJ Serine/Threonine acetyltransferase protein [Capsulimonas sp.]